MSSLEQVGGLPEALIQRHTEIPPGIEDEDYDDEDEADFDELTEGVPTVNYGFLLAVYMHYVIIRAGTNFLEDGCPQLFDQQEWHALLQVFKFISKWKRDVTLQCETPKTAH